MSELSSHVEQIAMGIVRGDVTPVLGAGASAWDRPPDSWSYGSEYPPSSLELAAYLAFRLRIETDGRPDLMRVASEADLGGGSDSLRRALYEVFQASSRSTLLHEVLARVIDAGDNTWPRGAPPLVLTTNYDQKMERALAARGALFNLITYVPGSGAPGDFRLVTGQGDAQPVSARLERDARDHLARLPTVVKLHGSVGASAADSAFVITESDYVEYLTVDVWDRLPWMVVSRLRHSRLLFLGYSMRDWNLMVVLRRLGILPAREPNRGWAVQPHSSASNYERWRRWSIDVLDVNLREYAETFDRALIELSRRDFVPVDDMPEQRNPPTWSMLPSQPREQQGATTVADRPVLAGRDCPYQGPEPFRELDAEWYFGRELVRDSVVDGLGAHRVIIMCGPPGCGKTSLLEAAVLRKLREEAVSHLGVSQSAGVLTLAFADWGASDPGAALGQAVLNAAGGRPPRSDSLVFAEVLRSVSEGAGREVFLLLDQLEALYSRDDETCSRFEADLVRALAEMHQVNLLLSVQTGALARLLRLQNEIPSLLAHMIVLGDMQPEDAREAIVRPLEVWNRNRAPDEPVLIQEALVDRLLVQLLPPDSDSDPEDEIRPGELQRVLKRIWTEARQRGSMSLGEWTLEELGGTEGIIRGQLDDALGRLSAADQKVATTLLEILVTPSGIHTAHEPSDLAEHTTLPSNAVDRVLASLSGDAGIVHRGPLGYEVYPEVVPVVQTTIHGRHRAHRRRGAWWRTSRL